MNNDISLTVSSTEVNNINVNTHIVKEFTADDIRILKSRIENINTKNKRLYLKIIQIMISNGDTNYTATSINTVFSLKAVSNKSLTEIEILLNGYEAKRNKLKNDTAWIVPLNGS